MKRDVRLSLPVLTWAALLMLLHATAIQAQNESAPPLPPPGKLVDVGGWRLHLNCTSEARAGQPTVILEPGIGDFSVEWSLVQPAVAKFARVCSYDRAGDGWSDWGPHPRTFRQIVYELHTLLDKAGVKPPFVLVGQSYGGWLARLYALTYPSDVAGMVLVDAGADDPWRMTNGKLARSSELVKGEPIPAIKTSGPLRLSDIPPEALRQMKAGAPATSMVLRLRSVKTGASNNRMQDTSAKAITPILNVSDMQQSFAWFEKLGWEKGWDWGSPPTFGGVCSGACEIFLCLNAQGGRGKSDRTMTFGPEGDETADKGVWMSVWVENVDAVYERCLAQGLEVAWPPTDMPWNTREMHVRHPDGHVFRFSQTIEEEESPAEQRQ